jgi:hypothetical protein
VPSNQPRIGAACDRIRLSTWGFSEGGITSDSFRVPSLTAASGDECPQNPRKRMNVEEDK